MKKKVNIFFMRKNSTTNMQKLQNSKVPAAFGATKGALKERTFTRWIRGNIRVMNHILLACMIVHMKGFTALLLSKYILNFIL